MKIKRIVLVLIILILNVQTVFAAPYMSFVRDKNERWSFSPSLYEPLTTLDVELNSPTDIFIDKYNRLYILEQQRLIFFDDSNIEQTLIQEGNLKNATGMFVDDDYIYIADKGDQKVKLFNLKGELVKEFIKPENPLYGKKENFIPTKIVVNKNKSIFVISDGNTNGIVQLDIEGKFLGYFGRNDSTSDFFQKLKEKVLKDTPLGNLIKVTPPSIHNMDIDSKGVIYASGAGNVEERVRRLNVSGKNIFIYKPIPSDWGTMEDIAVNEDFVMILDNTYGTITISDKTGFSLGIFGSKTNETPVTGLFLSPIAIAIDNQSNIYVLDATLKNVQVFTPTLFMKSVFEATKLYNKGLYDESKDIWREVINLNPQFALGNKAMGLIETKNHHYEISMDYFYRANDIDGYSEALWEIRQNIITQYLGFALLIVVALFFFTLFYEKYLQNTQTVIATKKGFNKIYKVKFFSDLRLMTRTLKKPNDIFYDIRVKNNISVLSALVLLLAAVGVRVLSLYTTGYIFSVGDKNNINLLSNFLWVFGLAFLFIVSNFLIISIFDGEGKFKHIFIGTVYSLAPFILFLLPVSLFSNVLTQNEVFLAQLLNAIIYGGVGLLLLIMIMEVHNYRFMESVRVFILTIFTMLLIVIIGISLYALSNQIISFVTMIFREVFLRV